MLDNEKVVVIKTLLGEAGNDDANFNAEVAVYLSLAAEKILKKAYPFKDTSEMTVPDQYAMLQCQIAVYLYNKQGAEGQTTHNENGIARTYENADVPKSMLRDVIPLARGF